MFVEVDVEVAEPVDVFVLVDVLVFVVVEEPVYVFVFVEVSVNSGNSFTTPSFISYGRAIIT